MKSVRKALFVLIGCLLFITGFGQHKLRIQVDSASIIPSTVQEGDSFGFNVRVYNDSIFPYTGVLSFEWTVSPDTMPHGGPSSTSGVDYSTPTTETIPAQGFLLKAIGVHVTPPAFKGGPSVVVIWPIALDFTHGTLATAADSVVFTLQVDTLVAAIEGTEGHRIRLLKRGNLLCIEKDAEMQVRQVRILDILGQQILDRQNPPDNIPLPYMNTGIYLAEITYNNNLRKVFRFYY